MVKVIFFFQGYVWKSSKENPLKQAQEQPLRL